MILNPSPPMKRMCKTCPFRAGSPYDYLQTELTVRGIGGEGRVCHSTGDSAIYGATGKPERMCRGVRDLQLKLFVSMGFLPEPTDAAWSAKIKEINSDE